MGSPETLAHGVVGGVQQIRRTKIPSGYVNVLPDNGHVLTLGLVGGEAAVDQPWIPRASIRSGWHCVMRVHGCACQLVYFATVNTSIQMVHRVVERARENDARAW